jgi:hypothetical protein
MYTYARMSREDFPKELDKCQTASDLEQLQTAVANEHAKLSRSPFDGDDQNHRDNYENWRSKALATLKWFGDRIAERIVDIAA